MGADTAREIIYRRLEEFGRVILSERGAGREIAKKERAFLEQQLARVLRGGRGLVTLAPDLERAVHGESVAALPTVSPKAPAEELARDHSNTSGKVRPKRPAYWASCEKMDFRELREFVDNSLRESSGGPNRPRKKGEFLELLGLLARTGGIEVAAPPKSHHASAGENPELRRLRAQRDGLLKALSQALRGPSSAKRGKGKRVPQRVTKLRRELDLLGLTLRQAEEEETERLANPRTEAQRLRKRHLERQEMVKKQQETAERRREIVRRIGRDIERAFSAGGLSGGPQAGLRGAPVGARRLPWRVLPPGELSLQRVLAHYERLGRARPDIRYEPERIRKAYLRFDNEARLAQDGEIGGPPGPEQCRTEQRVDFLVACDGVRGVRIRQAVDEPTDRDLRVPGVRAALSLPRIRYESFPQEQPLSFASKRRPFDMCLCRR